MDVRITVETPFDDGEKRIHQLESISRPYRVSCPEGFGLRLEDGKRFVGQIQKAILCDQIEGVTRESRVCPLVAGTAPSMTIARRLSHARSRHAFWPASGQSRAPSPLFLRCPSQRRSLAGLFRR